MMASDKPFYAKEVHKMKEHNPGFSRNIKKALDRWQKNIQEFWEVTEAFFCI